MTELLTAADVAIQLGVSPETVRRWVRSGQLTVVRLPSGQYRIRQADLDAMVREAS